MLRDRFAGVLDPPLASGDRLRLRRRLRGESLGEEAIDEEDEGSVSQRELLDFGSSLALRERFCGRGLLDRSDDESSDADCEDSEADERSRLRANLVRRCALSFSNAASEVLSLDRPRLSRRRFSGEPSDELGGSDSEETDGGVSRPRRCVDRPRTRPGVSKRFRERLEGVAPERFTEAALGGAVAPLFEDSDEAPDFDVVLPRFADTEEPDFVALADFDLDFVFDLEFADESDRVFILLNSYTGLKQSQSRYKRGNSPGGQESSSRRPTRTKP